jgi:transposase InsO family protein
VFDAVLADAGIEVVEIPARCPGTNAYAQRWVRTVQGEMTNRTLIAGQCHLRAVLDESALHYRQHRRTTTSIACPEPRPPAAARRTGSRAGSLEATTEKVATRDREAHAPQNNGAIGW